MAKEDATGQAVESSMEQLLDINRKQSEIISAQARTIEELRGTIVELNASPGMAEEEGVRKDE